MLQPLNTGYNSGVFKIRTAVPVLSEISGHAWAHLINYSWIVLPPLHSKRESVGGDTAEGIVEGVRRMIKFQH